MVKEEKLLTIIIVDDDNEIRSLLHKFLTQYHYNVLTAKDGEELFVILSQENSIDLILLDIMLPNDDGIELCKKIREHSSTPIIMLTAVNSDVERILSLELGADGYITKPFNPRELLAHIKAVLRRYNLHHDHCQLHLNATNQSPKYEFSEWILDTATRRLVSPNKIEVAMSAATYSLLLIFLEHPQRVLSRDQLLDMTKNRMSTPFDRSIDVQISRLRQKIEINPKNPILIKTVRTGGYMFTSSAKVI